MANVGEQLKKALADFKAHWAGLDAKKKKLVLIVSGAILALAIGVTLYLNLNTSGYVVLYEGMEKTESAEVFAALQSMEVPIAARMNNAGGVEVTRKDKDKALAELALQGIPKQDLPYGIYSGTGSLTSTDFDKRQLVAHELQNRLQATLRQISNVRNAVVTLNIADGNNRVWEATTTKSTASVVLTLANGKKFSPDQVYGIKNLVCKAVGDTITSADVAVIDAATGISLKSREESDVSIDAEIERLGYTQTIEQTYVDKVLNIISLFVEPENVRVSASIKLDYDKIVTESKDFIPSTDSNNNSGVLTEEEKNYSMNPGDLNSGVAGEEDNTDTVPGYVDLDGDGQVELVDSHVNSKYLVGYILKQVEKGAVEIKGDESSMAIALKADIDETTRDDIIVSAAKATGIPEENISVQNFVVDAPTDQPAGGFLLEGTTLWIVIGIAAGVLILLLLIIILLGKRKRKKKLKQAQDAAQKAGLALSEAVSGNPDFAGVTSMQELEARKKQIQSAAERSKNDNAITDEVRAFAKANPQITAGLLRSWMREDEDI